MHQGFNISGEMGGEFCCCNCNGEASSVKRCNTFNRLTHITVKKGQGLRHIFSAILKVVPLTAVYLQKDTAF